MVLIDISFHALSLNMPHPTPFVGGISENYVWLNMQERKNPCTWGVHIKLADREKTYQ